jgi:hypothetical protein
MLKEADFMGHPTTNDTADILYKIKNIEKEIAALKIIVIKKWNPPGKKNVTLKGVLKNVDITDQDIADAKKSLYSNLS